MTTRMHPRLFVSLACALALTGLVASPARAVEPPYLKLAQALGTPVLASSFGPKDKSMLGLTFVRRGETAKRWTKMTTVSILHVPGADTQAAVRGVILRLRTKLASVHAHVTTFEEAHAQPVTAYFAFDVKTESDAGFVYSPQAGYVTVAQLEAREGTKIDAKDIATLHRVLGGLAP